MTENTKFELAMAEKVIELTTGPEHHFFGYHDHCPWDATGRYILALQTEFADREVSADDEAAICLVDTHRDKTKIVGHTKAWNFQQGARLQWLGPDHDSAFLYNDFEDGDPVARVQEVGGEERIISRHLYSADPDGRHALSVDFGRFRAGYTYPFLTERELDPCPDDEGIHLVDLLNGKSELVVSIAELAATDPVPTMSDGRHWVDHMAFSPDGSRVAFLHRWELGDGGTYSRLYTMDVDGSNRNLLADSGKATHYDWRGNDQVLAWSREQNLIGNAAQEGSFDNGPLRIAVNVARRLPIPSVFRQNVMGDGYYLFDADGEGSRRIGRGVLTRDGHPGFAPEGEERWFVTDTYPDNEGRQRLLLYDIEAERRVDLASFGAPRSHRGTGYRCDLHPRWDRSGERVCVDSMHNCTRQLYAVHVGRVGPAGGTGSRTKERRQ